MLRQYLDSATVTIGLVAPDLSAHACEYKHDSPIPREGGPGLRRMHREHFGTSLCQHARIDFIAVFTLAHSCASSRLSFNPFFAFPNSGPRNPRSYNPPR